MLREHLLQKLSVVVVNTLFFKMLHLDRVGSVAEVDCFVFICVFDWTLLLRSLAAQFVEVRVWSCMRLVILFKPYWFLRVHQLHNVWQSRFQQKIILLLNQLLARENRRVSFQRPNAIFLPNLVDSCSNRPFSCNTKLMKRPKVQKIFVLI